MSQDHSTPSPAPPGEDSVYHLAELSYSRLDQFDRERTAVIFSVSPLEEHGTHLPVGTDLYEAEFFSHELALRITSAKRGWTALIGPPLPIGASAFEKTGTLLVSPRVVRNSVLGYGAALARQGFKYILVMNAHAGPRHVVALEEAASAVSRRYSIRMLSVSGLVLWRFLRGRYADQIEELLQRPLAAQEMAAMRGDAHAGLWETSLLLRIHPSLVGDEYRTLPPQRYSLLQALRKNYPLRLGNRKGYIGSPAAASESWGEVAQRLLLDAAWELTEPMLDLSKRDWQKQSILCKVPLLRTDFPYVVGAGFMGAAALALGALGAGAFLWSLARLRRM